MTKKTVFLHLLMLLLCSVDVMASVDYSNGELKKTIPLVKCPGGMMPLDFSLIYSNKENDEFPIGRGWRHSYDIRLEEDFNGSLILNTPTMRRVYAYIDGKVYTPAIEDNSHVVVTESGSYVAFNNGLHYNFGPYGGLVSITDKYGNATKITTLENGDTEILDPSGRSVILKYEGYGTIQSIIDPNKNTINLTYWIDAFYTIYPYPITVIYLSHILMPIQASGYSRHEWQIYDDPMDSGSHTVYFIDPESNTHKYSFPHISNYLNSYVDPIDNSTQYTYETNKTIIKDKNGFEWVRVYNDDRTLLLEVIDPDLNSIKYRYYPNKKLLSKSVPYSAKATNGTNLTRHITTFYTYDDNGNLLTETAPVDLATLDPPIDPATITNPASELPFGPALEYSYDNTKFDRITSVKDLRGTTPVETSYIYDDNAAYKTMTVIQKLNATDSEGLKTVTRYEANGSIHDVTFPDGRSVSYGYDPTTGLLTSMIDSNGVKTEYLDFNGFGSPMTVKITDSDHTTTKTSRYVYDELNQLTSVTVEGQGVNYVTKYGYDNNGNLDEVLDAEHAETPTKKTTYKYNYKRQMTQITNAMGILTEYDYSGCGSCGGIDQITKVTHDGLEQASYQYDSVRRLKSESAPLTHPLKYEYTPSSRLWYIADQDAGDKRLVEYTYDALDQIDHKLTLDENGATQSTNFDYDARGLGGPLCQDKRGVSLR